MNTTELLQKVEILAAPVLESLGLELIEREFVPDQGRRILRLYIDRETAPVTIDDCETASRALEPLLDVENLIPGRYALEVSSPGLNRPLRRPKDFERFAGRKVDIKTAGTIGGRRHFLGVLKGLRGDTVVVQEYSGEFLIPLGDIKKARIRHEFEKK